MSALNRFLGDSPWRVFLKLIVVSFLVGVVMSMMGWTPWDIVHAIAEMFDGIWYMGFDTLERFWGYLLLGAVVVVPGFILLRLLSYRR